MKFTGEVFFPELADLPQTGSVEWIDEAFAFAARCQELRTAVLVVCRACGWHHESSTIEACLSCGGPIDKAEFGEHERPAVLEALCRLKIRALAGKRAMILK